MKNAQTARPHYSEAFLALLASHLGKLTLFHSSPFAPRFNASPHVLLYVTSVPGKTFFHPFTPRLTCECHALAASPQAPSMRSCNRRAYGRPEQYRQDDQRKSPAVRHTGDLFLSDRPRQYEQDGLCYAREKHYAPYCTQATVHHAKHTGDSLLSGRPWQYGQVIWNMPCFT